MIDNPNATCTRTCHNTHPQGVFDTHKECEKTVSCCGSEGKQAVTTALIWLLVIELLTGMWLIAIFRVFGLFMTPTTGILRCEKVASYFAALCFGLAMVFVCVFAFNSTVSPYTLFNDYLVVYCLLIPAGIWAELYSARVFEGYAKRIEAEATCEARVVYPHNGTVAYYEGYPKV